MNLQRNLICLSLVIGLSACASYQEKPYTPVMRDFAISSSPAKAYDKAVDCATRVISVPSVGQFFQYESSQNQRFIVNYNFDFSGPWGLTSYKGRANFRVNVDGNHLHSEITNPQYYIPSSNHPEQLRASWMIDNVTKTSTEMLDMFGSCFNK
ncbi:hypothetical protein [Celerinatantimonas sp. MCCC 1A17872]|uniref:hypothetical protein n=1 Tax=Celerinatantimonas sp. MCCC 1A17872 TaxID=3177514 RepID=UPI0038C9D7B1